MSGVERVTVSAFRFGARRRSAMEVLGPTPKARCARETVSKPISSGRTSMNRSDIAETLDSEV